MNPKTNTPKHSENSAASAVASAAAELKSPPASETESSAAGRKTRVKNPMLPKLHPLFSEEDADLRSLPWYRLRDAYGRDYARSYIFLGPKNYDQFIGHRRVLERMIGRKLLSSEFCDHINGDRLDNRRENLRVANQLQNAQHKPKGPNFRGTQFRDGRWYARVGIAGKKVHAGIYDTQEDAAKAAAAKRIELGFFGEPIPTEKWDPRQHRSKPKSRKYSPFRGTTWLNQQKKWRASAKLNGVTFLAGVFVGRAEAVEAAALLRKKLGFLEETA